jgi:hypothetical protein
MDRIVLTHLRHFRWLPDGAGIINYQLKFCFVPLGSERALGHPLVSEGHGALLIMPRRSTNNEVG